jgi:hypothetical protein
MAKAKRTSTSAADDFNASRQKWLNRDDRAGPNCDWEVIYDSTLPAGAAEILRNLEEEERHKAQLKQRIATTEQQLTVLKQQLTALEQRLKNGS